MKQRILIAALAAAFALAACSERPAPPPTPAPKVQPAPAAPAKLAAASAMSCTGACDVDVTVTAPAGSGKDCTITSPARGHVINVAPDANRPTIIKWTLKNPPAAGYKFATPNGIAFDKGQAPDSKIMQNGAGGAQAVTVTDNHTGKATVGHWSYTIYVVGDNGINCKLDPDIDNNSPQN
jgi:hypothetical protein